MQGCCFAAPWAAATAGENVGEGGAAGALTSGIRGGTCGGGFGGSFKGDGLGVAFGESALGRGEGFRMTMIASFARGDWSFPMRLQEADAPWREWTAG